MSNDITMCIDEIICPKAATCKRSKCNTKPKDIMQSWASFMPKNKLIDMCDFYYPIYDLKVSNSTGL